MHKLNGKNIIMENFKKIRLKFEYKTKHDNKEFVKEFEIQVPKNATDKEIDEEITSYWEDFVYDIKESSISIIH